MHDWKRIKSCVHIAMTKLAELVAATTPYHPFIVQYQTRGLTYCNVYNFVWNSNYFLRQDYLGTLWTLAPHKQLTIMTNTSWSTSRNDFADKNVLKYIYQNWLLSLI